MWINPWERPRTKVEQEMLVWMRGKENIVAQQIGYRTLSIFRRELDEELLRRAALNDTAGETDPEDIRPAQSMHMTGLHPFDFFLYYVVVWIVTINAPRYRGIIRGVLPEVVQEETSFPDSTKALLRDLCFLSDHDIVEIASRLRIALGLAHRKHWFIYGTVFLVLIVGIIILLIGLRLRNTLSGY